jgi:ATP-binding cassette, subfamily B, heavy metal transporter
MSRHRAFSPDDPPVAARHRHTLARLLPYLWPADRGDLRARVLGATVAMLVAKLLTLGVPFLYKAAVDTLTVQGHGLIAVPVLLIVAYGVARVSAQGLNELRDCLFAGVTQHALRVAGLSTFRHIHRLSLRFHLERQTGGLSRVVERGTKGIEYVLRFLVYNIVPTLFEILLVCALLWQRFAFAYAFATFVTLAIYVGFTIAFSHWRSQYRREANRRDQEANTQAIDSLLNYETVKYFNNEELEAQRLDAALAGYQQASVRSQFTLSALNVGQGLIIAANLVVLMSLAATGVSEGRLTLGDFVMVNAILIQLYIPLNVLGFAYREITQGLIDMEKMFELLTLDAEIQDRPAALPLNIPRGEVRFEAVDFRYEQRRTILQGIDFVVPAGKTLAIVGPSGAGKSTIARLLFRFYDVSAGRIVIDGQDIRDVTQNSLRRAIGIVPQDTVLFNQTIAYNIRYGQPNAAEAEIKEAACLAHIDRFIEHLPDQYATRVGERGLKLSGGEKQRVAIARMVLKQPPIVIFDEATSALDSQTEKDIQQSLREVSMQRTTLIIAHRLSTVVDADEIIVLDDGHIVERGSHSELITLGGLYARMWHRQQEADDYAQRLAIATQDPVIRDQGSDSPVN